MLNTSFPQVNWTAKWKDLFQQSERCVRDTKVSMMKWSRPPDKLLKINNEGSSITNPGKIRARVILRDKEGRLAMDFTSQLEEGTNKKDEIEAAIFGFT